MPSCDRCGGRVIPPADGRYLSAGGAGGNRRQGIRARPTDEPAATITGKATACWTGPDGERSPDEV